ncbi:MAG TPA: hypothetical protein VL242_08585 [Sorangium sp.]|nr:hypothetical protein [Sorangium sp.]
METLTGELTFAVLNRAAAERLLGGPLPEAWRRLARRFARDRGEGGPG